jgi:hypothetical protein
MCEGDAEMKKSMFVVTLILLLSLMAISTVAAGTDFRLARWEQVFDPQTYMGGDAEPKSATEFNGKLYFFIWGETNSGVWVTQDGRDWSLAWDAYSIQEGCHISDYLSEFKGKLYLVMDCQTEWFKKAIMRTSDGEHWEEVAFIEDAEDFGTWYSGGFTSFQGSLYVGRCVWFPDRLDCRLSRSISGDPGTWEEVAVFPGWNEIASFASFNGALYVSSLFTFDEAGNTPAQVWRSFDGLNWEPVTLDGFGDPGNIATWSFGQKDSFLYIGMGNGNGGQIWRTKDGMDWQAVTQDGLGDPFNLGFGFVTYQNLLYTYSVNLEQGCRVYASSDGIHYTPVNKPGWGDPANQTVRTDKARVVFNGALYMGTSGFFAPAPGGVYRLGPTMIDK